MPVALPWAGGARWHPRLLAAMPPRRTMPLLLTTCVVALMLIVGLRRGYTSLSYPTSLSHFTDTHVPSGPDLSDPEAPFISWPLARVCRETSWMEGLVFECENNSGGIGNIRNFILTCIRYAISAGATGLIIPRINTRSHDDLKALFGDVLPFNYFFDERHFRASLAQSCPQITIWDSAENVTGLAESRKMRITPRDFGRRSGCDHRDLNRHTDMFASALREEMRSRAQSYFLPAISLATKQLIRFNWGVQWDYPVYKDGPEFVNSFGGLLRFREDILELGKATTTAMRRFAKNAPGNGSGGPTSSRFMGIHLRTENDALGEWPRYSMQAEAYLREGSRHGFHAAYLATGNTTEAKKLATNFTRASISVATKQDLLQDRPEDLKRLNALTWDQQALIDYVVLLYSDYFVGVSPSSFSMTVALKRHTKAEGLYTRPWKVGGDGDGLSFLVGYYEQYWKHWLFMYDSLWP